MGGNDKPTVELQEWVKAIIHATVAEHQASCPTGIKVQALEVRLSSLVAFMAGSGTLGGVAGAVVVKVLGG